MSLSPFLSQFSVNVYNPLGRVVSWSVRLPVDGTAYTVSDASGNTVDSQVCVCVGCICLCVCVCVSVSVCLWSLTAPSVLQVVPVSRATQDIRMDRGHAINELLFQVQAPPLGYTTYSISLLQDGPPVAPPSPRAPKAIENKVGLFLRPPPIELYWREKRVIYHVVDMTNTVHLN